MQYLSTRGDPARPGFAEILLDGLAPDGGLYLPDQWPRLTGPTPKDYAELTASVLAPFVAPDPFEADLGAIAGAAYSRFRHPEVAPLVQLDEDRYLMELYWGPTLSFKDYALSVVGGLFEVLLKRLRRPVLILGATSGDTGSAAIDACKGRDNLAVVILYPEGKITEVQRRQMTTVSDDNVTVVAVGGSFDDCQALVKRAFTDPNLGLDLAAVNSINWARIAIQAAYYVSAAQRVGGDRPLAFAVPTGNFGNVLAGYVASRMGTPIERLIIANNRNHGLADLVATGSLIVEAPHSTLAPAMDIQIPSNLERFLFEVADRDPFRVRAWQQQLTDTGRLSLTEGERAGVQQLLAAGWLSDEEVVETIRSVHQSSGLILDPHTAIAWEVGNQLCPPGTPLVTVATAHPAKFGLAVARAIGEAPALPNDLADLGERDEHIVHMANEYSALTQLLRSR
ncbi:MAG: threonine synthase [Acidimicrobiia bacterium]